MAFGIELNGEPITYSALSVIDKGVLSANIVLTKSSYPDVTEFHVVFMPVGIRDTSREETRPSATQTSTTISLVVGSSPDTLSSPQAHQYLVLGR